MRILVGFDELFVLGRHGSRSVKRLLLFASNTKLNKGVIVKKFVLLAFLFTGVTALAQPAVVSGCKLNAAVSGLDVAFGIALTGFEGVGYVECYDPIARRMVETPVGIRIAGVGIGPVIAIPTFKETRIKIAIASVGITSAEAMFGELHVGDGITLRLLKKQARVGRGLAVSVFSAPGVSLNVNFQLTSGASWGLGADYGIRAMTIMSREDFDDLKEREREEWEKQKEDIFNRGN